MRPIIPRERLARATLDKLVGAGGNHVLHALRPSHRAGELGDQVGLDLLGVGVGLGIDILEDRALRGREVHVLNGLGQLVLGGLHERRVESTTHIEHQGAFAPAAFIFSQASLTPSIEPEMTSWPGQL